MRERERERERDQHSAGVVYMGVLSGRGWGRVSGCPAPCRVQQSSGAAEVLRIRQLGGLTAHCHGCYRWHCHHDSMLAGGRAHRAALALARREPERRPLPPAPPPPPPPPPGLSLRVLPARDGEEEFPAPPRLRVGDCSRAMRSCGLRDAVRFLVRAIVRLFSRCTHRIRHTKKHEAAGSSHHPSIVTPACRQRGGRAYGVRVMHSGDAIISTRTRMRSRRPGLSSIQLPGRDTGRAGGKAAGQLAPAGR
jgi:hypothetical protein